MCGIVGIFEYGRSEGSVSKDVVVEMRETLHHRAPDGERLFFARDRVGEKPLYWTQVDGVFLLGSEIKALLEHPSVEAKVRADAIPEYLTNLVTSSPRTLYDGIYKLGAGECGTCGRAGV